jgi:hypothetical protein
MRAQVRAYQAAQRAADKRDEHTHRARQAEASIRRTLRWSRC